MYRLRNFIYNSPIRREPENFRESKNGLRFEVYKDEYVLVCDIEFNTEEDALLYKLTYPDSFLQDQN